VLRVIDRAVFAAYCEAWSDFVWACQELEKGGAIGRVKNGAEYARPAVAIKASALKAIERLSAEFGMSPASRARVTFPGTGEAVDPDELFLGPHPIPPPPASRRPKGTDRTKDQGHTNED
jgi:P27 family predicted phage terminase small subunit